jgi:hypothetical protein
MVRREADDEQSLAEDADRRREGSPASLATLAHAKATADPKRRKKLLAEALKLAQLADKVEAVGIPHPLTVLDRAALSDAAVAETVVLRSLRRHREPSLWSLARLQVPSGVIPRQEGGPGGRASLNPRAFASRAPGAVVLTNGWRLKCLPRSASRMSNWVLLFLQSTSSNALASFRTGVSNPSVNQP